MADFAATCPDPRMLYCTATTVSGTQPTPWLLISEKLCRDFLDKQAVKHSAPPAPKFSAEVINPGLTAEQQRLLWALLQEFDDVFKDKAGVFNHTVVSLVLKPGAKPVAVNCPRWTPAIHQYLLS